MYRHYSFHCFTKRSVKSAKESFYRLDTSLTRSRILEDKTPPFPSQRRWRRTYFFWWPFTKCGLMCLRNLPISSGVPSARRLLCPTGYSTTTPSFSSSGILFPVERFAVSLCSTLNVLSSHRRDVLGGLTVRLELFVYGRGARPGRKS
jgi:hypothetical protein